MSSRRKIIRVSTVPLSLKMFCKELLVELSDDYDVLAVSAPGSELDDLAALGIRTQSVPMVREISLWADIKSLVGLIRLFRKERPDIVHSVTPKAGLLAMIAAWMARVPVRIHSFTGLLFPTATGLKQLVLKTTDRITCACASHILPEGQGIMSDLKSAHITSKPMRVLGYGNIRGVDLTYFSKNEDVIDRSSLLAQQWGISNTDFTFLFLGRIVKDKGFVELAEAFSKVVKTYPHAHLVIVGVEEAADPLPRATKSLLESTPNVHFSDGWVEDVRPYYAMADALVFPSYREGFPNVVLEAGAMALPAIVTDINGSMEIVTNDVNGHIVPPRDADALCRAMMAYVADPVKVKSMAGDCRQIIARKYDAVYVRDCLKTFYREVIL